MEALHIEEPETNLLDPPVTNRHSLPQPDYHPSGFRGSAIPEVFGEPEEAKLSVGDPSQDGQEPIRFVADSKMTGRLLEGLQPPRQTEPGSAIHGSCGDRDPEDQ